MTQGHYSDGPAGDPVVHPVTHVLAGALFDIAGRVLIAERPPGKHMAGQWEFPGGKRVAGESRLEALRREFDEELGVTLVSAEPLISYEHQYDDRTILLDLWRITHYTGQPHSREGQKLAWVRVQDLDTADLLQADRPMIEALRNFLAV